MSQESLLRERQLPPQHRRTLRIRSGPSLRWKVIVFRHRRAWFLRLWAVSQRRSIEHYNKHHSEEWRL
ncbi:hypothetical protein M404DRAFT_797837 [Pisolithus tinctorius Marx 270]|uniref:Uncharacterized protein n=1 Tax=Pisolithus tinctorius Marx 270 TaxID=870435 RepID=A0A0C3PDE2_PISTI|nr:hypothetical protein M404DRAFT_797837 [Pisolithus tinctorius Marx 270]